MKNFATNMKTVKTIVSLFLMLAMLVPIGTFGVSAVSAPAVYSHEDGGEIIAGENLTVRFDDVHSADHYYIRAKVLKNKPSKDSTNEKALSALYDFEIEEVTSNRFKIYGYDLPSEDVSGKYLKIYIEARDRNGSYISHETIYLFIRKPFEEFVSPWEYGILPMTTVKKGASGDHIKALRQAVNIVLGYDALKLTAKFDDSLVNCLKQAQGKLSLKKDGIFGKDTRAAFLKYLEENGFGMENTPYDPDAAIAYAMKHNMKHSGSKKNPLYPYHSGANCANFVAQCLVEGGLGITSDWNPDTKGFTLCRYAPASRVNGLLEHLMALGYPVYGYDTFTRNGASASRKIELERIQPGDVIFCATEADGISAHAMIVHCVKNGVVYYHGNTKNRCGCATCGDTISLASITTHVAMSEG